MVTTTLCRQSGGARRHLDRQTYRSSAWLPLLIGVVGLLAHGPFAVAQDLAPLTEVQGVIERWEGNLIWIRTDGGLVPVRVGDDAGVRFGEWREPGRAVEFVLTVFATPEGLPKDQWVQFFARVEDDDTVSEPLVWLEAQPGGLGTTAQWEPAEADEIPVEDEAVADTTVDESTSTWYRGLGQVRHVAPEQIRVDVGRKVRTFPIDSETFVRFQTRRPDLLALGDEMLVQGRRGPDGIMRAASVRATRVAPEVSAAVARFESQQRERRKEAPRVADVDKVSVEPADRPGVPAALMEPDSRKPEPAPEPGSTRDGVYYGRRLRIN